MARQRLHRRPRRVARSSGRGRSGTCTPMHVVVDVVDAQVVPRRLPAIRCGRLPSLGRHDLRAQPSSRRRVASSVDRDVRVEDQAGLVAHPPRIVRVVRDRTAGICRRSHWRAWKVVVEVAEHSACPLCVVASVCGHVDLAAAAGSSVAAPALRASSASRSPGATPSRLSGPTIGLGPGVDFGSCATACIARSRFLRSGPTRLGGRTLSWRRSRSPLRDAARCPSAPDRPSRPWLRPVSRPNIRSAARVSCRHAAGDRARADALLVVDVALAAISAGRRLQVERAPMAERAWRLAAAPSASSIRLW